MNRIDAHSHIWSPDTERFPLAPGVSARELDPPSFTDAELLALVAPYGVERVVLIQHSIFHRFDNSTLVDAVRRRPEKFRAVGMVDDRAPDPGAAMRQLLPLGVTGFRIRPLLHPQDPLPWLDTPGMHAMWETAAETRQAMCCLIEPCHLPEVDAMCERHPATPVVIDHLARVGSSGPTAAADLEHLCALARHPEVCVKVSGFYALGERQAPYADLVPLIGRVHQAFGAHRLMWGSDAPYQLRPGHGYAASIEFVCTRAGFAADDLRWLLHNTAERVFFRLPADLGMPER